MTSTEGYEVRPSKQPPADQKGINRQKKNENFQKQVLLDRKLESSIRWLKNSLTIESWSDIVRCGVYVVIRERERVPTSCQKGVASRMSW